MPWAAWKASAMGMIVAVSALLPSLFNGLCKPLWKD